MNNVSAAFAEAGLTIPLNRRVWQWLKDNGPHTNNQVAAVFNQARANTSSCLSTMAMRGMVSETKEKSVGSQRMVSRYAAVGKVFQLRELTPEGLQRKRKLVTTKATSSLLIQPVIQPDQVTQIEKPSEPWSPEKFVEDNHLTLSQAKSLRLYLNEFFLG